MKYLIYKTVFLLSITVLFSCKKTLNEDEIPQLITGFWEIEKVETTQGNKEYKVNTTVDYFYVNNKGKGYRLKTDPNFSGTYKTNTIKDTVVIWSKNDSIYLKTTTQFDTWQEVILSLTPEKMVIKNKDNIIYHYKKHQKFDLN